MVERNAESRRDLQDRIDSLQAELTERRAEIVRFRQELEERVEERTRDLKEREARISAIVDTAIDGIITIDEGGIIRTFNHAAVKIFGYPAREVIGRSVSVLMTDPDRSRHAGYIAKYLETGQPRIIGFGREVQGLKKDGTRFSMQLGVGEVDRAEGRMFVGTIRDLTEFKEMQKELLANQNLAALGEMAASVAHEIKNPLAAISGVIAVLRDRTAPEDPHSEILDDLIERLERLDRTVKRLLQFARPASIEKQRFNLWELVESVSDSVIREERLSQVELRREGDRAVDALVDLTLFEEVLRNLLYNSAEAMPEGGVVTIETGSDGSSVWLKVKDSGIGMSPEVLEKAFQLLFTTKGKGTGLGLSLCRRIMDAHGGSIHIRSRPGKGTVVQLELPKPPSEDRSS